MDWRLMYRKELRRVLSLLYLLLRCCWLYLGKHEVLHFSVPNMVWLRNMTLNRRGIAFNYGKFRSSDLFNEFMDFVKKYHGYVMSFGTIYNFHYHPAVCDEYIGASWSIESIHESYLQEGTVGHFGGFLYQSLLMWQSASFLHTVCTLSIPCISCWCQFSRNRAIVTNRGICC